MIKLVKDTINSEDIDALCDWLKSYPQLTKGPLTLEFEKKWSEWQGSKFSVFVNSGSSANLLMALALLESGRLKNKTIIAPAVSWVTTVTPFTQFGFDVHLCDCDPDDLGLDIDHFERLIKEKNPAAVILVHVLGHPNKIEKIMKLCNDNGIHVIEDCCEAHGAEFDGKKVGSFGLMGSFSFYFGHHMSTIEGGMVVTDDEEIYNALICLRAHGWIRDFSNEKKLEIKKKYEIDDFQELYTFIMPGLNVRPTDLNAFLGLRQLLRLDETISLRQSVLKKLESSLDDKVWIQRSSGNASPLSFALIHDKKEVIVENLRNAGVECRPLICGSLQEHPFWYLKNEKVFLPNASRVHKYGFYVPCHQGMTDKDCFKLCEIINNSIEESS